jgi:hypothetical protein
MNGHALEKGDTQNLEKFVEAALELEFLLEECDKHVDGDGDSDLALSGNNGFSERNRRCLGEAQGTLAVTGNGAQVGRPWYRPSPTRGGSADGDRGHP